MIALSIYTRNEAKKKDSKTRNYGMGISVSYKLLLHELEKL